MGRLDACEEAALNTTFSSVCASALGEGVDSSVSVSQGTMGVLSRVDLWSSLAGRQGACPSSGVQNAKHHEHPESRETT